MGTWRNVMTVWVFYLLLVFLSESVEFSWIWFLVSIVFSSSEVVYKYKYTSDPKLDGQVID